MLGDGAASRLDIENLWNEGCSSVLLLLRYMVHVFVVCASVANFVWVVSRQTGAAGQRPQRHKDPASSNE